MPDPAVTFGDLERKARGILDRIETKEMKEALEKLVPRGLERVKATFNVEAVSYCIDKYVYAERDYHAAGNRGLGRHSEYIPRLGGHFRKQILSLPQQDRMKVLDELEDRIREIMIGGYLAHAVFAPEPADEPTKFTKEELYEKWIPRIYSTDPTEMDDFVRKTLILTTYPEMESMQDYLEQHGMGDQDKTPLILGYYAVAGYGIRFVEMLEAWDAQE